MYKLAKSSIKKIHSIVNSMFLDDKIKKSDFKYLISIIQKILKNDDSINDEYKEFLNNFLSILQNQVEYLCVPRLGLVNFDNFIMVQYEGIDYNEICMNIYDYS